MRRHGPRPRTWKRTLLMVLLLLTSGAIVNVAVAWGYAIWSQPDMSKYRSLSVHEIHQVESSFAPDDWARVEDADGRDQTFAVAVDHIYGHTPRSIQNEMDV